MKNVNNSIIPALSNNNHELFHSNLWAWLIEADNQFMKVFFEDYDERVKIQKVYREKLNTDLLIEDEKGNHYVIENKLKSIANEEQLNEYKVKVNKKSKNKDVKYLLVFLIENKELKEWNSIDYIKVAQKMGKVLKKEKNNKIIKKYYDIINEYCKFVEKEFEKIINSKYVKSNKYDFSLNDKEVEEKGLKVIYQKMKAEKMKEKFDKEISISKMKNKFENNDLMLSSKLGYNNGKPCLTYRVQAKWESDLKNHTAIELQIEGCQFRYMVRLIKNPKDRGDKTQNRDKYFNEALKIFKKTGFLTDIINLNNKNIHGKKSSMKNDYCSYDGGKKTIGIYQYNDIAKNETYKKLSKEILKELKKINRMVKNNNVIDFLKEKKTYEK